MRGSASRVIVTRRMGDIGGNTARVRSAAAGWLPVVPPRPLALI